MCSNLTSNGFKSASSHDVHQHCFKLGYPKNKSLYDSFFKVFNALTGAVFKCNFFEIPPGGGGGRGLGVEVLPFLTGQVRATVLLLRGSIGTGD